MPRFVALLSSLMPSLAFAQLCVDYSQYLHWVGGAAIAGYQRDVKISGELLFVVNEAAGGDMTRGLRIYSVTKPSDPALLGSLDLGDAYALAVSGSLAYVTTSTGFHVVDASNPSAPFVVGSGAPGASSDSDIELKGSYAYVRGGVVVDVSNPASPQVVGSVPMPGLVYDLAINGDIGCASIYQLGPGGSLQVLDFSDPSQPVIVGSLPMPDYAYGVGMSGDAKAYVACVDSLFVVDVANPASPQIVGAAFVGDLRSWPGTGLHGVTYHDGYAYVASQAGLWVFDVSNPEAPLRTAHFDLGNVGLQEVAVSQGYAFAVPPLSVFELNSNASSPRLGEIALPPGAHAGAVTLAGHHAYFGNGSGGFSVVDVTVPTSPMLVGNVTAAQAGGPLVAFDDRLYVTGEPGLHIFDVSNPGAPAELSQVAIPGALDVAYESGRVFVAADSYLWIVSVWDPTSPMVLGSYHGPVAGGQQQGLDVRGEWAYIASGPRGVDFINISRPSAPQFHRSVDTPGFAHTVQVSGHFAYVADGEQGGLQVIALDDPMGPHVVGSIALPGNCMDVAVVGSTAYAAVGYPGIMVVDVSDPAWPRITGVVSAPVRSYSVAANPSVVCATDLTGMITMAHQCGATTSAPPVALPVRVSLLAPYPNPFNPRVRLPVEVGAAARLRLTIFDAAGHEVTSLANRIVDPGRHEFIWNGLDAAGRGAGSGVYFVTLDGPATSQSRKLLLVK